MSERLRWGIIGCGDVVERKSGPSVQRAGRSEIIVLMRRNREKLQTLAEKLGAPSWTDRADVVIHDPRVDIVYVATPPSSHENYVLEAAKVGKHVLVEKPMAMEAQQAERMVEACERAGVQLFVAYYRRFHPHVLKMRELIRQGRIGEPLQAFVDIATAPPSDPQAWRLKPEISGGGLFVDVGSHRVDVVVRLLGEINAVCGVTSTFEPQCRVEQTVSLCLRFLTGAQCVIMGDFLSGRKADRLEIIGTEGRITTQRLDGHAFVLHSGHAEESFSFDAYPAPHLGLIRHIEGVLLDGKANESSGRDGLITETILDAAVRGAPNRPREHRDSLRRSPRKDP